MKVLAHKAFSLFRIISLGFSEVELLGQSLNISKALDTYCQMAVQKDRAGARSQQLREPCLSGRLAKHPAPQVSDEETEAHRCKRRGEPRMQFLGSRGFWNPGLQAPILDLFTNLTTYPYVNNISTFWALSQPLHRGKESVARTLLLLNHVRCPVSVCAAGSVCVSRG